METTRSLRHLVGFIIITTALIGHVRSASTSVTTNTPGTLLTTPSSSSSSPSSSSTTTTTTVTTPSSSKAPGATTTRETPSSSGTKSNLTSLPSSNNYDSSTLTPNTMSAWSSGSSPIIYDNTTTENDSSTTSSSHTWATGTGDVLSVSASIAASTSESPSVSPVESSSASHVSSAVSTASQSTAAPTITTVQRDATKEKEDHTAVIVGVVVGVGGGLIVIAVVVVAFLYYQRRSTVVKDPLPAPNGTSGTIRMRTLRPYVPRPDNPVKVSEFLPHVAIRQNDMKLYKDEFDSLPPPDIKSQHAGYANEAKNRYINILPFDETIVPLDMETDMCSYINASFINGHNKEKAFIATQGPLDKTTDDFWSMVWKMNSTKIVMVTNVVEGFKPKCHHYWPKDPQTAMNCGAITVRLVSESVTYDYTIRRLSVQKGSEPERTVYQYHYTTWPDHGVPETCTALLKFHNAIFNHDNGILADQQGPVIIHCSAGVGRSGTLVAINILLQVAAETKQLDIPKCIDTLRSQRMYMVQTVAQYMFLHQAMLEVLLLGDVTYPASPVFGDEYNRLCQSDALGDKSAIERQFQVLDVLKPKFPEALYTIAKSSANSPRNRSSSALPAECNMVCLRAVKEDENTYINAVFVKGYHRNPKEFQPYIATQMPLQSTVSDFWRLVKDNLCDAIVMLNDLDQNNNTDRYWPLDGQTMEFNKFTVTNIGPELSSDNILLTNLKVTYSGKLQDDRKSSTDSECSVDDPSSPETANIDPIYVNAAQPNSNSFTVRHMRILNWPTGLAFPRDKSTLLSLYSEVVSCQEKNPKGRILVHCLQGTQRTGLFCAVMNVMDQLQADNEVNVYDSVKRIRQARPEFISSLEEYHYLYQLATTHLSKSDQVQEIANDSALYSNISQL